MESSTSLNAGDAEENVGIKKVGDIGSNGLAGRSHGMKPNFVLDLLYYIGIKGRYQ
jgi:hypothetical protein